MTDEQHQNDYLKLKVHTTTNRTYYCNRTDWNKDNDRVLVGAYTEFDSTANPDLSPVSVIIDGPMDIVEIRESKWILPSFFQVGKLP